MARKHEAAACVLAGLSPSQIAQCMGITVASVMGYLFNQVGEGKIRRVDIVFSIDREVRKAVEKSIKEGRSAKFGAVQQRLERRGIKIHPEDLKVYLGLRGARVELGDLYELLRDIELFLHSIVKSSLIEEYGPDEWWRSGVPVQIRKECASMREDDTPPADDLFCYTTLIQIAKIFDCNWTILSKKLPPEWAKRKPDFMNPLNRINKIRNAVMHPCKGLRISDDDFLMVKKFYSSLTSKQRIPEHFSFANLHST